MKRPLIGKHTSWLIVTILVVVIALFVVAAWGQEIRYLLGAQTNCV